MKLTVEHLGRIRHAELDIQPLTVIAGENGTNKTWTTYSLFALLEGLRWVDLRTPRDFRADPALESVIRDAAEELRRRIASVPRGTELHEELRRDDIVARTQRASFTFTLEARAVEAAIACPVPAECRVQLDVDAASFQSGRFPTMRVQTGGGAGAALEGRLLVEYPDETLPIARPPSIHPMSNLDTIVRGFTLGWRGMVRCLPAERKLLAQTSPAIMVEQRELQRPLIDFAYMMSFASGRRASTRRSAHLDGLYRILGGHYIWPEAGSGFQFVPDNDPTATVPLIGTASLVKSLVGMEVFLRDAGPGDVLFIDEPEMNAHPRAQAAILELCAMLAGSGITVVITTHSPYLLDHLTNLIEGATLDAEAKQRLGGELYLKDAAAFLRADQVAVYGFEEREGGVEVRSLLDRDERDIDWSTFTKISDDVGNLYGHILRAERTADR